MFSGLDAIFTLFTIGLINSQNVQDVIPKTFRASRALDLKPLSR